MISTQENTLTNLNTRVTSSGDQLSLGEHQDHNEANS